MACSHLAAGQNENGQHRVNMMHEENLMSKHYFVIILLEITCLTAGTVIVFKCQPARIRLLSKIIHRLFEKKSPKNP